MHAKQRVKGLFSHHFPAKASSDISGHGGDYVAVVETKYVRWSVRMEKRL